MWEVVSRMGEDVRGITEETGLGNLPPIPQNGEDPDVPVVEDIPLETNTAGPSSVMILPCFDAGEEVSSVKDSVTSAIPVNQPTKESTGVLDVQPIGDEIKLTPEGLQAQR